MAVQLLKKCGNSPALRLPAAVMADTHLTLDQAVEVRAEDGQVSIEPAGPSDALDDLLAGITPENRHAEQDFGTPQGRELV